MASVIKICPQSRSTWAGGSFCEECRAPLVDPFGAGSRELPEDVWRYIRLQYGARRGMLVRVMAALLGPVVAMVLLRRSVLLPMPWMVVGMIGALGAGVLVWWTLHRLAGKAVRLWVLWRGQVHKARLARALLKRAMH